jgi:hypothetical protein
MATSNLLDDGGSGGGSKFKGGCMQVRYVNKFLIFPSSMF